MPCLSHGYICITLEAAVIGVYILNVVYAGQYAHSRRQVDGTMGYAQVLGGEFIRGSASGAQNASGGRCVAIRAAP